MRLGQVSIGLVAVVGAAGIAVAAPGGKGKGNGGGGEDPPASFVPEILYKQDGQKSEDIRFANRTGDQSVLIYRGSKSVGSAFDASSEATKMLSWSDGGDVYLTSWSNDSGFDLAPHQVIHTFSDRATGITFSNGDNKIAMSNGSAGLYVYNIPANNMFAGSVTQLIGEDFKVYKARWSPDDTALYFFGGPIDGDGNWSLYRYQIASDTLTPLFDRITEPESERHDIYIDVSHRTDRAVRIATTKGGYLQLYDGSGNEIGLSNPPAGDNFAFNCNDTKVLHRTFSRRKAILAISDLSGGTDAYGSGEPIATWMRRVPCQ